MSQILIQLDSLQHMKSLAPLHIPLLCSASIDEDISPVQCRTLCMNHGGKQ